MVHYLPQDPDNKAIRELRDELKDLNKSLKKSIKTNELFTKILILVAIIQLAIAFFQFIASLVGPVEYWIAIIIELMVVVVIWFAIRSISRHLGLEDKKQKT